MEDIIKNFCCAQSSKNESIWMDAKTALPSFGEKVGDNQYSVHVIGFDGFYFERAYYCFTNKTWYFFHYDYTDDSYYELPFEDIAYWLQIPDGMPNIYERLTRHDTP